MKKGKYVSLVLVAVIAFVFVALRQPQSVLLVVAFALLAERDGWLNRQVIQALLLMVTYYTAILSFNLIFDVLGRFLSLVKAYRAKITFADIHSWTGDILYWALLALSLYAIVQVVRGKEAGLPVLSKASDGGIGSELP